MPKAADFSAIYGIRHIASGRMYVGSAVRTNARWRQHRSQLQRGTHHSRHLQAAWNKYGAEAFEFVVLEMVPASDDLLVRENEWISSSMAADRRYGFNCCQVAGSQLGMRHSDEVRSKMSSAHKGRKKSPEHQAAINASLKGRTLSDEHRAKIVANQTGRKASDETRMKMRESQATKILSPDAKERMVTANIGRKFSEEHRNRIAEANRRRTLSPEARAKISAARKRNEEMKKKSQESLMGYELRTRLAFSETL